MKIKPPKPIIRQNKAVNPENCSCRELINKWGYPRSAVKCDCDYMKES